MSANSVTEQAALVAQFDMMMSNRLVASIDLQGHLCLEDLDGKLFDTQSMISALQKSHRLQKELAIVWVPTEKVVMTDVVVPGKRKAHWMAALPFALEEGLSESIDHYHISAYARDQAGLVSAAIVSHDEMQAWQQILKENGLEHAQLVPDCFRLVYSTLDEAAEYPVWYILKNEQRVLARTAPYQGLAADTAWFPVLKTQYMQKLHVEQEFAQELKEQMVNAHELLTSSQQNLPQVSQVSLSKGSYKSRTTSESGWYEWRWVGALSLLLVIVWLATQIMQTQQLQKQAAYTQSQTEKLFKQLFPESKRIVNIKAQTLTKLSQGSAGADNKTQLLPILQAIEPWLLQSKNVKLTDLKWDQKQAQKLVLNVQAVKSSDLEKIVKFSQQSKKPLKLSLQLKNVTNDLAEGVIYVDAN